MTLPAEPTPQPAPGETTTPPPPAEPQPVVSPVDNPEEPKAGGEEAPAKDKKRKPKSKSSAGVNAQFSGGVSVQGNFIIQDSRQIQHILGGEEHIGFKSFTPEFVSQISPHIERQLADIHVSEESVVNDLYTTLSEKHLLVLTGEPETGKTTTALYLSYQLRTVYDSFKGAHLVRPLDRTVEIDFEELIKRRADFGQKLLLFKDAFAYSNQGVRRFFSQMGKPLLTAITETLQQNHMFIVFTADIETVSPYRRQFSSLDIEKSLPPMSDDILLQGLEKKLTQLAGIYGWSEQDIEHRLPATQRLEVVKDLRTMPRIAHLLDHYLVHLGQGLDLREALNKVDNLHDWFLNELTDQFEAWCFALTLTLCHCWPDEYGVPWFEFEFFREQVTNQLRRTLRYDRSAEKGSELKSAVSETFMLNRCRAEIYRDATTGKDCVRFTNERYPTKLWDVLLRSSRRVLSWLLPKLRSIAESEDGRLRARAAGILGRIGEIDSAYVVSSAMDDWINSSDPVRLANVGYLYQGIWASHNTPYRQDSLRRLNNLSLEEERPEVWASIAAYKQLGFYDLPMALDKYKDIATRKFAGTIENLERLERIRDRIEKALEERSSELDDIESMALAVSHDILREIAARVFNQESAILLALQYAVVALSINDPIKVLDELRKWTIADRKSLGALVALMFLEQNGIASELERRMIETPTVSDIGIVQVHNCNMLVTAIGTSDESVRHVASFLVALYESFIDFFPPRSRSYFRKSLAFHLKGWVENTFPVPRLRDRIVQLFEELLSSPNPDLRDLVSELVNFDPDFGYAESKYASFRQSLQRRRVSFENRRFKLDY